MPKEKFFPELKSDADLPKIEEDILEFWQKEKIFEKSISNRKDAPNYSFYDGPPFASGTPHYGHIVASTIKDVFPRYFTMKGFKVDRVWGWDCHGLPIENIAEQELGFKSKKDIEKYGVKKFNDYCRSKVLKYADEWKTVINRLGRWVDMENAYKTMDLGYMESVWWVFKQLYDKGLVYEGYRSMHICPRCETTLSQSEVAEGYKMVKDLSAIVKFELIDEPNTYILAWTTTPWTLLGNVALAVSDKIKYKKLKIKDNAGKNISIIVASQRVKEVVKQEHQEIAEFFGSDLVGKNYKQLFDFDYFDISKNKTSNVSKGWQVVAADFVIAEEGTGIVHIAPAFGEDDLKLKNDLDLPFIQHIGIDGVIKEGYGQLSGLSVKPAKDVQKTDVEVIKYLAKKNLLFDKSQYEHSYPHCWRCDTPLLNFATSSWFVAVEKIKDKAIKSSQSINWQPNHIKDGRFGKWLEGARDWSISRQRFWASVIPVWRCKCGEMRVVGSIKELEDLSGEKISDLHKHAVDQIKFPCSKCKEEMARVPDVLDTWFDSGSMPYAQLHYPFDPSSRSSQCSDHNGAGNKESFDPQKCPAKNLPADFIAEGVDQTRAWFYYLHVLATAIVDEPVYKNVVVNGIVLAEDGKKMSKRLQNYPDPMKMFEKYGADVVRIYLLSSPVMQAENLNFNENELNEIRRRMFRMIWNSLSFFTTYANIDNWKPETDLKFRSTNLLDRYIYSELQKLIEKIDQSMKKYDLVSSSRALPEFVDNLSNWYIRRSRKRFWKSEDDLDKNYAYETLYLVLVEFSKLLAPFAPFLAEKIFRSLTKNQSVHLAEFPIQVKNDPDSKLTDQMHRVKSLIEEALSIRNEQKIKVRQPLQTLEYSGLELDKEFEEIIFEELNVKEVKSVKKLSDQFEKSKSVALDLKISDDLKNEGEVREIIRQIQQSRKSADFKIDDRIILYYKSDDRKVNDLFSKYSDLIAKEVLSTTIENRSPERSDFSGKIRIFDINIDLWFSLS